MIPDKQNRLLQIVLSFAFVCTLLLMTPAGTGATSFNTVSIDGINDFASDEALATSTGGAYEAYVTWDSSNLYLGYSGNDVETQESSTKWMVWYIDTDPACAPTTGSGTTDAQTFNTQDWTLPFNADYFIQVQTTVDDGGFYQLATWTGSSWNDTGATLLLTEGGDFVEFSVSLADLGNPSSINALGYFLNEVGGAESTYGIWPSDSDTDGYKSSGSFSTFYHYELIDSIAPNVASSLSNCPVSNVTQSTDHYTIQDGIANAASGDVIEIAPGTYNERVTVDRSVTLQGSGIGSTILDGNDKSSSGGAGISLASGVDNVTIADISVTQYETGILRAANSPTVTENIVFEDVDSSNNYNAGIHFSGSSPARNIRYTRVTANNNDGPTFIGRGIFMQSHDKENIVVEDGTFNNNRISGIDLNIGALDGVHITNNTVSGNNAANQVVDSGIAILGLINTGTYENVISGNIVSVYGRFGIEIKGAQANGNTSGPGSLVVSGNNVSHADPGAPLGLDATAEDRDLAGIAVGNINSSGDPAGVVVLNNTVSGFRQYASNTSPDPDTSTGFCVSISGANYLVESNDVSNCDVGIQEQQGFTGAQSDTGDVYFGRDNSSIACGTVTGNTYSTNTVDQRQIGSVGSGAVTNADTGESFCTIQSAIDDSDTLDGHALNVATGTYTELIDVTKSITLAGTTGATIQPSENIPDFSSNHNGSIIWIQAADVTIRDLEINGDNPTISGGYAYGGADINAVRGIYMSASAFDNALIENVTLNNLGRGINLYGGQNHNIRNNTAQNLGGPDDGNYGYGILLMGNISAQITGNNVSETLTAGIFMQNNSSSGNTQIQNNTVVTAGIGLGWNMMYGGATGLVQNNTVDNVGLGMQVTSITDGSLEIRNNTFTIPIGGGEEGFLVWNTAPDLVLITDNQLTGSDNGVVIDDNIVYGAAEAHLQLTNNIIDGATTAITVTSVSSADAVTLRATGNTLQNATTGVNLNGTELIDSVVFAGNTVDNVSTVFDASTTGSLFAYANNITNFTTGVNNTSGALNAMHNWWGGITPTGVNDADAFDYRLGAAVSSWGEGTLGSASLTSAGGTGAGVIVSHGRGLANVPFGKGDDPYASDMCSDYYDFFVLNGSGNWTVSVPTDADTNCDETRTNGGLYQFTLNGTMPDTSCTGGPCWEPPTGVTLNGTQLDVTLDASTFLYGTPFVAGDRTPDSNDPTAVQFQSGVVNTGGWNMALLWLTLAVGGLTAGALAWRKRIQG